MGNSQEWFLNDPIYGLIHFPKNGIIHKLIDSMEFQRLRNIKQLGFVDYVYPGASNSRFCHSLGVAWLTKLSLENLLYSDDFNPDDFIEFEFYNVDGDKKYMKIERQKKRIINTVVAAALLHDIGHGPFSHTLEYFWFGNATMSQDTSGHEQITKEIVLTPPKNGLDYDYHVYSILSSDIRKFDKKLRLFYSYLILLTQYIISAKIKSEEIIDRLIEVKYYKAYKDVAIYDLTKIYELYGENIENMIEQGIVFDNISKIQLDNKFLDDELSTYFDEDYKPRMNEFVTQIKNIISSTNDVTFKDKIIAEKDSFFISLIDVIKELYNSVFFKKSDLFFNANKYIDSIISGKFVSPDNNLSGDETSQKPSVLEAISSLVHSELDCDRIDYLLRDQYFAGVQLKVDYEYIIKNQKIDFLYQRDGEKEFPIVAYHEKAATTIDDFFITRFHHYPQIAFNKTARAAEAMCIRIIFILYKNREALKQIDDYFFKILIEILSDENTNVYLGIDRINKFLSLDDVVLISIFKQFIYDTSFKTKVESKFINKEEYNELTNLISGLYFFANTLKVFQIHVITSLKMFLPSI